MTSCIATSPKPSLRCWSVFVPSPTLSLPDFMHCYCFSLLGEYTIHLSQSQAPPTHCSFSVYLNVRNRFVYNSKKIWKQSKCPSTGESVNKNKNRTQQNAFIVICCFCDDSWDLRRTLYVQQKTNQGTSKERKINRNKIAVS